MQTEGLSRDVYDIVRNYCQVSTTAPPPPQSVWPPPDVGLRGLLAQIPKAIHATDLVLKSQNTTKYMAQEKINGVWVLWDGKYMWTKSGEPIAAPVTFTRLLPPGFALVAELYLGGGHEPFYYATALATGRTPDRKTLPEGTLSNDAVTQIWQHARLIAFDAPGLGPEVTYKQRYEILRIVVGAWSFRQKQALDYPYLLPLQLIRQYSMENVEALFREVVEGTLSKDRMFPAFGIPEGRQLASGDYEVSANGWVKDRFNVLYGRSDATVSGEGLMLWDQSGVWCAAPHI